MKCKCENEINIDMAAKIKSKGCKILTSITSVITAECSNYRKKFQVPISSENYIVMEK